MRDKFRNLPLREAMATQIFYTSPEAENLVGKTLNSERWDEPVNVVTAITFRRTGTKQDTALEKLIAAKSYKKILELYDKPDATFKLVVMYKDDKDEIKEMSLTNALSAALSPEELPKENIRFLLDKKEFSFLKK
jgi:hypothetical protein